MAPLARSAPRSPMISSAMAADERHASPTKSVRQRLAIRPVTTVAVADGMTD